MPYRHRFKSASRSPSASLKLLGSKLVRDSPLLPSRPHQSPFKGRTTSPFYQAAVPHDLFEPPPGAQLRVIRASPAQTARHKAWFLIETTEKSKPPKSADAEIAAARRGYPRAMLSNVQIITTPTADTQGTCLLLHFDNQRYVFGNISEGTQRAMVQRKVPFSKTEDIFMSGVINWHNAGGLVGMILTLADIIATQKESVKAANAERREKGRVETKDTAIANLRIHGSKNLTHLLATTRRFVFRKGLPLRPQEIRQDPRPKRTGSEPDWEDSNIKVWYMPVESDSRPARKRSHEEMDSAITAGSPPAQKSTGGNGFETVSRIVNQMFNSDWKMDALTETTLHQAKLPAKLFIRNEKGHIQPYKGPLPGDAGDVPNIPVLVRQPWPAALHSSLPATEPAKQSLCYLVKSHDRRGKFNVKEAQKYAIAKSDYKKLAAGETVTASDGVVVTPEMVLGETVLGQGFAVLDIPEASYVEPLTHRSEWANAELLRGIEVAFWILGPGLVEDPRLQSFMQKHNAVRHVVCSPDTAPNMLALESAATQTYKLHQIDPDRFPLPYYSNEVSLSLSKAMSLPDTLETGRTGKTIQFSPHFLHQDDKIVPFPDIQKLARNSQADTPELESLVERGRARCADPDFLAKVESVERDIPNRDAEIITLGTGSALPSKYRNVSATLVRVPGFGNYLFDAGENTMGQLRRVFGTELPSIIRDLKVIWISHLHADHHLGTAGVIKAWNDATKESNPTTKLHVASHTHMIDWLREYAAVEDYGYSRLTFTSFSRSVGTTKICIPQELPREYKDAYGLEKIDACYVEHCHGALATVFTWPSGLKIAYSGDCRPSDSFVEIGQNTTLLIHESTFDDELKGDAIAKKHSTMSEAIDVGRRMGARRIMLTHFSQRYQKVPILEENLEIKADDNATGQEKAKVDEVVLVAFDYMRVKLGDFRKAQAFLPAVQKLLEDVGDQ